MLNLQLTGPIFKLLQGALKDQEIWEHNYIVLCYAV